MKSNRSPAHFYNHRIAATTASTMAVNGNAQRTYLAIQNLSGGILYVDFGTPATANSFQIANGATWEPNTPPNDAIYVMGSVAGPVNVLTGQLSA